MTGENIIIEKAPKTAARSESFFFWAEEEHNIDISTLVKKAENPKYLYWSDLKRKSWIPDGISPQTLWSAIQHSRQIRNQKTPLKTPDNHHFSWIKCAHYDQLLHDIDLNMGGKLMGLDIIPDSKRAHYISQSLIEESIASAQLEGAHTTRKQAVKMLQEKRTPADLGQRMIYNNYQTMCLIEDTLKDQDLTLDMIFDLQTTLTKNTLKNPDESGRYRRDDEDIVVASADGSQIAHIPPKIDFVKNEMKRLVAYANDTLEQDTFTHPLIKAITLHFWIGYLHPFPDGNGRLARALFYWYMLKKGYWAFAFIPISTRIKKSPKQYVNAYIYSEQDNNDLTYFIDYNLRQLQLARQDFIDFATKKQNEHGSLSTLSRAMPNMNDRQLGLMQYFITHPNERTNVSAMQNIYNVTAATAVKDLKTMHNEELLTKERRGKNVFYYPTEKLLNATNTD
ncbi:MAG: Fic family protein [Alphaproteobacteria bacterium]